MAKPLNFEEYLADCRVETHEPLRSIRQAIKAAAPAAEEIMSYSMPAFRQGGMLAWYAVHTHHIGFYPRASAIDAFKKELSAYKTANGSVQFPLDKPIPLELVSKMVRFRLRENQQKAQLKRKKL